MTARISTGLRNFLAESGSVKDALHGGKIYVYSGSQPTTADAAPTGTLLCVFTDASGAHTNEVAATGTVTLTGGGSGSVNSLTVDGIALLDAAVNFNTSLTQTAADVVTAINATQSNPDYIASSFGAVITITARRGTGAEANGLVVASTTTTITKSDVNMSGGVSSANGLKFQQSASGILSKLASQTWSGVASATGTAGWFRFVGPIADTEALDSAGTQIRLDGAVSTSGQQLNFSSTSFTVLGTQTITSFDITVPAS